MAETKEYPQDFTEFSLDDIDVDSDIQEIKDELNSLRTETERSDWEVFI